MKPPPIEEHEDWRASGVTFVGGVCVSCGAVESESWHPVADDVGEPFAGYSCDSCGPMPGPPLAQRRDPRAMVHGDIARRRIERG